jgi:hypothetical protein
MEKLPDSVMNEVLDCIDQGQKIEAIKQYRLGVEETRGEKVGLKEAKDFIEELTAKLKETSPESFKVREASGGCLLLLAWGIGAALLFALLGQAAAWVSPSSGLSRLCPCFLGLLVVLQGLGTALSTSLC